MRSEEKREETSKSNTKRDATPFVFMALLCGSVVVFSFVNGYAQEPASSPVLAVNHELFYIDKSLMALVGIFLAISSAAVGWGLAMGKIRAHCEDGSKHYTIQELDMRYYSKGEIDRTIEAGIAKMTQAITEKMLELLRRGNG